MVKATDTALMADGGALTTGPALLTERGTKPRVALIHNWLVGMRGGEKVLEAFCEMFPAADIYTHVVVPDRLSPTLRAHTIRTTRIAKFPMAPRLYQKYLSFMPRALEEIDLTGYDLVISSESGPAKGVIAPPEAPHLCFCHSPMRYLWDQYHTYRNGAGRVTQTLMPHLAHALRQWDVTSAARVDRFAANSTHVAARIQKYWRREADIVYPPCAVEDFAPAPRDELGDYYLWAGELAPYKRPDLCIEAFNRLGKKLVMIGGPEKTRQSLTKLAGPNVTLLGHAPFATLKDHMARCKALIFPGEEDFGIIPVEVMASGRPVIAYGRGGALDTVRDGETGLLFHDQTVEGLMAAVEQFETDRLDALDPTLLTTHAARFDKANFVQGIQTSLARLGMTVRSDV